MKPDTAERLAEQALQMSHDLNEMVRDIQGNEPDREFMRLRHAIGRVMWSVYYEILQPVYTEHPSLAPDIRAGLPRAPHPAALQTATRPRRPAAKT